MDGSDAEPMEVSRESESQRSGQRRRRGKGRRKVVKNVSSEESTETSTASNDSVPESAATATNATVTNQSVAEGKKELGNTYYKQKSYKEALQCYTDAIEVYDEDPSYYNNRAACLMMMYRYKEALTDTRAASRLDHTFIKGYIREAKCLIAMGDPISASAALQKAESIDPGNPSTDAETKNLAQLKHFEQEAEKSIQAENHRSAIFWTEKALTVAVSCPRLKVQKARQLAWLGRYSEASDLANDVLHSEGLNADALYVRGLCLYYEDNVDKAFNHFQQVLRLHPDHSEAKLTYKRAKLLKTKKEAGNEAFKTGRLQEAYNIYTEALAIDSKNSATNSKLYCNRATVCSKIGKMSQCIEDCTRALADDANYTKAYLRRGRAYMDTEQYDEAVRDYEAAFKIDRTHEIKEQLNNAKLELKKSKRKDYYKILGVDKNAADDEIKKGYKKRALLHHPDRHSDATPAEKEEHERKFKEVGEAYAVLTDAKKRSRYDRGQDLDDGFDGFSQGDIDPNNIFQAFFSSPGSFSFQSAGTGGGPSYQSHGHGGSQGFPGGFSFQFG